MGRPKGSKNATNVDEQHVEPSRCKQCDSTKRTPYNNRRVIEHAGADSAGRPYRAVILRRCKCQSCGQVRDDRSFDYLDAPAPASDSETDIDSAG